MATWTRSEHTTRTVRYTVPTDEPVGAAWNQVQNALTAATGEYKKLYGHLFDDVIRVHVSDDAVIIEFEME